MTLELAGAVKWLLQHATLFPDTIVLKQPVIARGTFERVAAVASGLVSISLVVLTAGLVPVALAFRRRYKKVNDLLDRVYGDVQPLVHQARIVAENASVITTTLRADLAALSLAVRTTNGAVMRLVERTEHRLGELDVLLTVAQHEAEGLLVTAASTVRGAQAGARAFGAPAPRAPIHGREERPDEPKEEHDGDDNERTTGIGRTAPRIRPSRARGHDR